MTTKGQTSIEEDNHQCLCGQTLTKYPYNHDECQCCCKEFQKAENTYHFCNGKQCTYRAWAGYYFCVCSACYESMDISNIDAKHSFLFCKLTSLMGQIRKEDKQCTNNDQRRRYMYRIYFLFYQQCIAKLKAAFVNESEYDEIVDMFNAFYGGIMGEINRNIDLMELGVSSDTFASAEKRNKKRKEWEKMNTISSEWQRLRKEETLEEQKEEKASECDDMCCNDTAKCGSRKRIQLVMRCYRRNFLNRFDYHAMDHATDDAHDDMQYIEVFEHALDRYNATDLLNDYFHIEQCHGGEKELRDCVHNGADDGDDEDIVCCSLLWRAERDSNDSKIFAEYLKTLDSRQINILDISSKIHRFLNHYSPQQQTDSCVRALTRRYKASKHNKFVNEIDGEADTRQQAVEPMLCIDDQLVRDLR
eukprot:1031988_1